MKSSKRKDKKKSNTIDDIGITHDTLTSRAGLTLFVRYLAGINLYPELKKTLWHDQKKHQGQSNNRIIQASYLLFA